jgi:sugar lactone lactonase YvrE
MKKSFTISCLLALIGLSGNVNAQNISTIAGTGASGYSGNNGLATSATLSNPLAVTIDGSGNIYIADFRNNVIRKVDHTSNVISTFAGNGTAGYSGNNSAATSAQLNAPYSIAVDASNNIYIADQGNNVIRKVDANGIITTYAGNAISGYNGDGIPATSAQISNPMGVAVDNSGNVYIADNGNNRIRKVDASTGIISTVAGNGTAGSNGDSGLATSAMLNSPAGVATDASGNVYVADYNNHKIRKVDANTGIISTVAGNGTAGYNGDNNTATLAELNFPTSVAIDASGNIYIADVSNNRIRKVTISNGNIITVAGNGTSGFNGDGISLTDAELNNPSSVAIDSSGNLYIADFGNNRIRK